MFYTITQAAKLMGVSEHTLRYYEKEGFIQNVQRGSNGNRQYSVKDLQWVYLILCLRDTGMSLKEIQTYINYTNEGRKRVPERYEMILKQKEAAMDEIQKLNRKLALLEDKLEFYSNLMNDKDAPDEWNPSFDIMEFSCNANNRGGKNEVDIKSI